MPGLLFAQIRSRYPEQKDLPLAQLEGLREQAQALSVRRTAPDEWAREELLLRKLGAKGWGRVYQFRNCYGSGWGENGRVLSPRALDAFFRFVEAASFPSGSTLSVFLTDRGGIELCWEP